VELKNDFKACIELSIDVMAHLILVKHGPKGVLKYTRADKCLEKRKKRVLLISVNGLQSRCHFECLNAFFQIFVCLDGGRNLNPPPRRDRHLGNASSPTATDILVAPHHRLILFLADEANRASSIYTIDLYRFVKYVILLVTAVISCFIF